MQKGISMNYSELHFIPIDQELKKIICEGEKVVSALFCAYHLQYQILNFSNNRTFKIASLITTLLFTQRKNIVSV
jgi:hypothetical protein